LMADQEKGEETPPKPKKPRMVNVYNAHRFRSIHLGGGRKIGPGQTGKIPYGIWKKVEVFNWIKRAERGDVL
jgi:hypothetical protein